MIEFIKQHINSFLSSIEKIEDDITPLELGDVCTVEDLEEIEKQLEFPLPEDVRRFALEQASSISFYWGLPDDLELTDELNEIFCGEFDFNIFNILDSEECRKEWIKECFPNPEDDYDKVWHNKIGFHNIGNGDVLAFNREGNVVYLSHDDGAGHGIIVASSFTSLIKNAFPIGFPGPEAEQWLPFWDESTQEINPHCDNAQTWLRLIKVEN